MLRLVCRARVLTITQWGDADRARQANKDALILGPDVEDGDAPAWELATEDVAARRVVLTSGSQLSTPVLVGAEWEGRLWLAHGARLYAFPEDLASVRWIELESPVSDLRVAPHLGSLVAVCETCVVAIGHDLGTRWSLATDVITNVEWKNGILILEQLDGPAIEIDIESGRWRAKSGNVPTVGGLSDLGADQGNAR